MADTDLRPAGSRWTCGQCGEHRVYTASVSEGTQRRDLLSHHELRHPVEPFTPSPAQASGDVQLRRLTGAS